MGVEAGRDLHRLLAAERAADQVVARARREAVGLLDEARRTASELEGDDEEIRRQESRLAAEIDAAERRALDDAADSTRAEFARLEALESRVDELAAWLVRRVEAAA